MAEEEQSVQLEEWEASEEKQDAPLSAMDEQLLFESKVPIPSIPSFFFFNGLAATEFLPWRRLLFLPSDGS